MTGRTLAPFEADVLDELLDAQRRLSDAPISNVTHGHPTRRRVAVTLTVAAAVGGAATVVVGNHSTPPSTTRPESPTTPSTAANGRPKKPLATLTVAVIARRAEAKLANVDDLVVHSRETRISSTSSGTDIEVYESWSDRSDPFHSRTKYTHNGVPVYDIQQNDGGPSERVVDYPTRSWYQTGPVPSMSGHGQLLGWTPDVVRKLLSVKGLTLVGHETIDGRDTLHLARHDIAPIPGDLWIDPTTYLIVRSSNPLATTDYQWLPRNAASLAQLVPVVPPGFTLRGQPPETPPGSDGNKG